MKILILGSKGQLGNILTNYLSKKKIYSIYSLSRTNFDLTKTKLLMSYTNKIIPNVIINCTAYTDVNKAENEKEKCKKININIVRDLCVLAKTNNALLIHFSTDFVFDGKKGNYKEKNKTNPINYYGYTKRLGESIISKKLKKYIIIRTSWLYSNNINNFYSKIIEKVNKNEILQVVDDQYGFPTSAYDLAKVVIKILNKFSCEDKIKYGLYHYSNYGKKPISWFEFAKKINYFLEKYDKKYSKILNISSKKLKLNPKRPANSSLNIDKICNTFNIKKKFWNEELRKIIKLKVQK